MGNKSSRYYFQIISFLLLSLFVDKQVIAFYEWNNENSFIEFRGLIRASANVLKFENDSPLYEDEKISGFANYSRLLIDGGINDNWSIEGNVLLSHISKDLYVGGSTSGSAVFTDRSSLLEKTFDSNDFLHLEIDRLAVRWINDSLTLTFGRQAINLATTYFFTPNDFFSPFSAQTFYRVYKSGVDAIHFQYGIGDFTELSYMTVFGYSNDTNTDTGWSDTPESTRISHIIKWSDVINDFEASIVLGNVVNSNVIGGSLQGEVFDWLGIRIEGNYTHSYDNVDSYEQVSFGLEHKWESSYELRAEVFYNGNGVDLVSDYVEILNTNEAQYLARYYSAIGGVYDITALLIGQITLVSNLVDKSHLLSLNTIYSVSENSELSIVVSLPYGKKTVATDLKSEFGAYPKAINIEFRIYF